MISPQQELIILIYVLYFLECIHWLRPGEVAQVRSVLGKWKSVMHRPGSYTLLGRMPCLQAPWFPDVGYFLGKSENRAQVQQDSPGSTVLEYLVLAQMFLLLGVIPIIIWRGFIVALWGYLVSLLMLFHIAIIAIFARAYRKILPLTSDGVGIIISLALNPLAALRCMDRIAKAKIEGARSMCD
jgi:hypothetical protein